MLYITLTDDNDNFREYWLEPDRIKTLTNWLDSNATT